MARVRVRVRVSYFPLLLASFSLPRAILPHAPCSTPYPPGTIPHTPPALRATSSPQRSRLCPPWAPTSLCPASSLGSRHTVACGGACGGAQLYRRVRPMLLHTRHGLTYAIRSYIRDPLLHTRSALHTRYTLTMERAYTHWGAPPAPAPAPAPARAPSRRAICSAYALRAAARPASSCLRSSSSPSPIPSPRPAPAPALTLTLSRRAVQE